MVLHDIEDEIRARRWIDHPDAAAEWMSLGRQERSDPDPSLGAYPTVFVGTLAHLMTVAERVN
jgi:hypothetical protein